MDPSLLEQFLGPSSTQFQLPVLHEDEADQLHPLISTAGFQRFTQTRKSLPGKVHTKDKVANLFDVFPLFPSPNLLLLHTSDIYADRLPFRCQRTCFNFPRLLLRHHRRFFFFVSSHGLNVQLSRALLFSSPSPSLPRSFFNQIE